MYFMFKIIREMLNFHDFLLYVLTMNFLKYVINKWKKHYHFFFSNSNIDEIIFYTFQKNWMLLLKKQKFLTNKYCIFFER